MGEFLGDKKLSGFVETIRRNARLYASRGAGVNRCRRNRLQTHSHQRFGVCFKVEAGKPQSGWDPRVEG